MQPLLVCISPKVYWNAYTLATEKNTLESKLRYEHLKCMLLINRQTVQLIKVTQEKGKDMPKIIIQ